MALPKLPPPREEPDDEETELGGAMTFIEHLEELRERLIKCLLVFALATFVCLFLGGTLADVMLKPYKWGIGEESQPILNIKDKLLPALDRFAAMINAHFEDEATSVTNTEPPGPDESGTESEIPAKETQKVGGIRLVEGTSTLVTLSMLEMFKVYIKLAIVGGIFISFPILFYQVWRFVAPGLYKREKRFIFPTVISAWICFITGGLFAYFFVIPTAVYFFSQLSGPEIMNTWSVDLYFNNALHLTLAFGVIFEEPVVIGLLAVVGLVRAKHLSKWRPYVIVGMFVLGAILTPPDPVSQIMCAVPLLLLYEGSAFFVRIYERARGRKDAEDEDED
ncbi:MAG: twin-arginine translocase subunit TatC, partial [bacterium]